MQQRSSARSVRHHRAAQFAEVLDTLGTGDADLRFYVTTVEDG